MHSYLHDYKEIINISENTIIGRRLIMMFKTHTKHIQKNTYHNENIKFLICC
jgi:hypothetical protein